MAAAVHSLLGEFDRRLGGAFTHDDKHSLIALLDQSTSL